MKKWTSSPGFKVALIAIPIFIGALDLTVVSAVLPHVSNRPADPFPVRHG